MCLVNSEKIILQWISKSKSKSLVRDIKNKEEYRKNILIEKIKVREATPFQEQFERDANTIKLHGIS